MCCFIGSFIISPQFNYFNIYLSIFIKLFASEFQSRKKEQGIPAPSFLTLSHFSCYGNSRRSSGSRTTILLQQLEKIPDTPIRGSFQLQPIGIGVTVIYRHGVKAAGLSPADTG